MKKKIQAVWYREWRSGVFQALDMRKGFQSLTQDTNAKDDWQILSTLKQSPKVSPKKNIHNASKTKKFKNLPEKWSDHLSPTYQAFWSIVKSRKRRSALLISLLIQSEKLKVIAKYQMVQKFSMLGCITYGYSFFCWVECELRSIRKDMGHPHMKIKINKCKEPNTLKKEQSQTQPLSMQDCNAICFWVQTTRM